MIKQDDNFIKGIKDYLKAVPKEKGSGVIKLKPNFKCPKCGHEMHLYNHIKLPSLNDQETT